MQTVFYEFITITTAWVRITPKEIQYKEAAL